jgi:diguanylate cyclase (GGDEF)-like protein
VDDRTSDPDLALFKGFARTVAEMEWLLLLIAVLYLLVVQRSAFTYTGIIAGVAMFLAFFTGFHYINFFRIPARWKLAVESWAMIAFITWMLWFTGRTNSPLIDLYLIVIVTSGLTLGKLMTLLEVSVIVICCLLLRVTGVSGETIPSVVESISFIAAMAPFLLIGYLTAMLADDMHFANRRLQAMMQTDDMTGLLNVRMFRSLADREYARAVRYQDPFSILVVDTDNLKAVNEAHGHMTGDRLLATVAEMIAAQMRQSDIAARYGGDEFIVLLPHTESDGALDVARRLLWSLDAIALRTADAAVPVSVSIGIAAYPADAGTVKEVIDRADQAMYQCKREGKNSAVVYRSNAEGRAPAHRRVARAPTL